MKKKILMIVAVVVMMASVASASPLTDYSHGKVAVDLTWRNSEVAMNQVEIPNFDKKYNVDLGFTAGLGNNWAIQYRQFDAKSKDYAVDDGSINLQLETQEVNVLYKVDKNVAAYAGIMETRGIVNESFSGEGNMGVFTNKASKWQVGLVGTAKLAEKTTAYASIGTGKDLTTWQFGIGQEIGPNLEFNVDYRSIKAKNFELAGRTVDLRAKGLGCGVTYKF